MGREGAKGEGISLLRSAPPSSLSAGGDSSSPSTSSPSSSPPFSARPPSLPCVRKRSRSQNGEGAGGGGGGGRVRVGEGHHLSLLRSQAPAERRGFSLRQLRRQRWRLPESRRKDAQSHGALVLGLVLQFGHRQCGPGGREPRPGLLDRRLQQGCSERFLRGGVGAGTVRLGAAGWAREGRPGPGGAQRPARGLRLWGNPRRALGLSLSQ